MGPIGGQRSFWLAVRIFLGGTFEEGYYNSNYRTELSNCYIANFSEFTHNQRSMRIYCPAC